MGSVLAQRVSVGVDSVWELELELELERESREANGAGRARVGAHYDIEAIRQSPLRALGSGWWLAGRASR